MDADLLNRRERYFVLWRLAVPDPPPQGRGKVKIVGLTCGDL